VIIGAGDRLELKGQVAVPPGLMPAACWRIRKRLESTPSISAMNGKAVIASSKRVADVSE